MYNLNELKKDNRIFGVSLTSFEGPELTLREDEAQAIGAGFISWLASKLQTAPQDLSIAIGRDSRSSCPRLFDGLMDGIGPYGCRTYDFGLASSPAMEEAVKSSACKIRGGIMISGGGLPYNMNGISLFTADGIVTSDQLEKILELALNGDRRDSLVGLPQNMDGWTHRLGKRVFEAVPYDYMSEYCRSLREEIVRNFDFNQEPLKGLKITVDASNGSGGYFAVNVLKPLGADISSSIYLDPDGMFDNHEPDINDFDARNALSMGIISSGSDLGILFDSDCRSFLIMDSKGFELPLQKGKSASEALAGIASDYLKV